MKAGQYVKTPVVLQMEAVECGAAALGIVLSYYGLFLPLERLRQECGVSRNGSKAGNILRAALRLGMEGGGYRCTAEELKSQQLPIIIHWNFNHFLVVEGFAGNKVYLNDPATGHRTVSWAEFETSFTGIMLSFIPGPGFQPGGSPPSTAATIARMLAKEKKSLLFVLLVGLGLVVPGLAIPVFTQVFIDDILSGKHTGWLFDLLLGMGITVILQAVLTWLRSWQLTRWQGSLTVGDSSRFFWHVLRLPLEFFQQRYGGEIASRVQFNETVATVLTGQAATAVLDVVIAIFYLLLLFQYNITLTVIGIVFSLINIAMLRAMFLWMTEQQMKIQQEAGKAYGLAIAGIQTIETIKANGNEGDFFAKWAGYQAKIVEATQKSELSGQVFMVAPSLLNGINTACIMAVGGFEIMDGLMTAGIFMAFQNLMGKFQEPLGKLLNLGQALQTTGTQLNRLEDVVRYPVDELLSQEQTAGSQEDLSGRLELKAVAFGYSRLEPPLIENFSLVIEPGRWVALVGGSGSGKSTVAKLVAGLYQPWAGEILFDNKPRVAIDRDVLTSSVGVVDQDIFLFEGTVADNIALFDATVSRQDIVQAAKDAAIHQEIAAMQGGYDALLEEGGRNLSGGQRQRLEIARALALNPSLLILDEATSALDPLAEAAVIDSIKRRGCACLVVAHRLSTIRDCDEIIVMEQGKIIQRGTHETMLAADGPYRRLVADETSESKSSADGGLM